MQNELLRCTTIIGGVGQAPEERIFLLDIYLASRKELCVVNNLVISLHTSTVAQLELFQCKQCIVFKQYVIVMEMRLF